MGVVAGVVGGDEDGRWAVGLEGGRWDGLWVWKLGREYWIESMVFNGTGDATDGVGQQGSRGPGWKGSCSCKWTIRGRCALGSRFLGRACACRSIMALTI